MQTFYQRVEPSERTHVPLVVFPPSARQRDLSRQVAEQLPTPTAVATASRPSLGPAAFIFMLGAAVASTFHSLVANLTAMPWRGMPVEESVGRPPDPFGPDVPPLPPRKENRRNRQKHIVPDSESVEWVNMCVRKIWRVYQRGLESWISGLLQPVFDNYINEDTPPAILKRIRIARFTLNHEPPVFESMQRRNSRKESDLNGVFSVRYSGGAKMLLVLELGGRLSGVEIPVMVEDFDLDARMWIKVRLAPMCPWVGVISVAFVEQPRIQVQLNTYGMLPLMRIPVLQRFLRKLLTVELPGAMVLPQRLEINLPPSVTVLAEAAVGRDTVMRAVASAVLQADAMEQALINALPMDAHNVASAVSVPEAFVVRPVPCLDCLLQRRSQSAGKTAATCDAAWPAGRGHHHRCGRARPACLGVPLAVQPILPHRRRVTGGGQQARARDRQPRQLPVPKLEPGVPVPCRGLPESMRHHHHL
jgi:hypothetical protein